MNLFDSDAAASTRPAAPPSLPAAVWRASELASFRSTTVSTGFAALDREIPDEGWPRGALTELLVQQPGIGEIRLLVPALRQLSPRKVALIQPPHKPHAMSFAQDLDVDRLIWVSTSKSADALWAAEQVLRNGAVGALMLWQAHIRPESLRRLHLAAQASDVVFWLLRPLASAQDTSPAPLRLALRPAIGGIRVEIVKRRGPRRDDALYVPLPSMPAVRPTFPELENAPVDLRDTAVAFARDVSSAMV
jgi:protein ImuA